MTTDNIFHLFVYGSLRSGFRSPAYEYISRFFDLVAEARVKGKLYDMGEYPAALPTTEEAYIKGELYIARNKSEFSWAITQLDDYEGVLVEPGEQQLYRRELAAIDVDGTTVPAWIYWYNGRVDGKPEIPSGDILDYLK